MTQLPAPVPSLCAVVVVPARDEAARIRYCLAGLARQREVKLDTYEVIVVLDGCRDHTRRALEEFACQTPDLTVHAVELENSLGVGRARRLGMDLACQRLLSLAADGGLIASTDADSVVAPDWLATQLELSKRGAHAIGGLIELDPEESRVLPAAVAERERRATTRMREVLNKAAPQDTTEHHQFSGASLAVSAAVYQRCGGLPVRAALEDEALEHELSLLGVPIHRSRRVRVSTSARTSGRAPRGLARDLASSDWCSRRCYTAGEFPLERLLDAKQSTIGLILPAREVAQTIRPIAELSLTLQEAGLLDEVLVIDAASHDGTAEIAEQAGISVLQESELSREYGPACGKGDAMWRALRATSSEIVAYADTDTRDFKRHFLLGILGPLICEPDVQFVKGAFRRPFRNGVTQLRDGGGRVTELMARPLLNLHAPELAVFNQPLAGETAARRELLERLPFSAGYGVEIAMLIDAWRAVGLDGLAQVDLGVRQNRHQPLRDLSAMAYAVLLAAQTRFLGEDFADAHACGSMAIPALDDPVRMETRRVTVQERPPLTSLCGQQPLDLVRARAGRG